MSDTESGSRLAAIAPVVDDHEEVEQQQMTFTFVAATKGGGISAEERASTSDPVRPSRSSLSASSSAQRHSDSAAAASEDGGEHNPSVAERESAAERTAGASVVERESAAERTAGASAVSGAAEDVEAADALLTPLVVEAEHRSEVNANDEEYPAADAPGGAGATDKGMTSQIGGGGGASGGNKVASVIQSFSERPQSQTAGVPEEDRKRPPSQRIASSEQMQSFTEQFGGASNKSTPRGFPVGKQGNGEPDAGTIPAKRATRLAMEANKLNQRGLLLTDAVVVAEKLTAALDPMAQAARHGDPGKNFTRDADGKWVVADGASRLEGALADDYSRRQEKIAAGDLEVDKSTNTTMKFNERGSILREEGEGVKKLDASIFAKFSAKLTGMAGSAQKIGTAGATRAGAANTKSKPPPGGDQRVSRHSRTAAGDAGAFGADGDTSGGRGGGGSDSDTSKGATSASGRSPRGGGGTMAEQNYYGDADDMADRALGASTTAAQLPPVTSPMTTFKTSDRGDHHHPHLDALRDQARDLLVPRATSRDQEKLLLPQRHANQVVVTEEAMERAAAEDRPPQDDRADRMIGEMQALPKWGLITGRQRNESQLDALRSIFGPGKELQQLLVNVTRYELGMYEGFEDVANQVQDREIWQGEVSSLKNDISEVFRASIAMERVGADESAAAALSEQTARELHERFEMLLRTFDPAPPASAEPTSTEADIVALQEYAFEDADTLGKSVFDRAFLARGGNVSGSMREPSAKLAQDAPESNYSDVWGCLAHYMNKTEVEQRKIPIRNRIKHMLIEESWGPWDDMPIRPLMLKEIFPQKDNTMYRFYDKDDDG
eukprot:CAMPEP_0178995842 /NCGR_PEP_ID=MMETSP0795-20121207/8038_1 /TAXON_ID=88552 /ORGANISM="Amoebophrya sp., Strain Ameob2" /LENGTH=836 /DNA_ID=CAMNT_0020688167 /DNA_START=116 /DNA_END=2623 /DNA_ORIENTATION=-